MITKAEIMERAALKIDLSTFPAEALEKMNEMFNGDYAGAWQKWTPRLKKALIYICRRLGVLLRCGTQVKAIQQKFPGLITMQRTIILCWNLATGERSVFAMAALRRWDIPGNFTGYSTPPLENVELNFCKTKPGAQSPGIIIYSDE